MRRFALPLFASALVVFVGCQDELSPPTDPDTGPTQTEVAAAQAAAGQVDVIVQLDREIAPGAHGANKARAAQIADELGVEPRLTYGTALFGFAGTIPEGRMTALANDPRVVLVERDFPVYAIAQTLPEGVDRVEADQNSTAAIDNSPTGVDVDVAIIDTGIDLDHGDLNAQHGINCFDETASSDDDHGHGTHVAGTVGAIDDNADVVGVAPGARVYAVKVLDSGGSGTIATVNCGIDWVTANAGTIEAANMSLGAQGTSSTMRTAIQNSVGAGIFYAVAAGNSGQDVYGSDNTFGTSDDYIPAAYPEVAAVSAMADFDGTSGGDAGRSLFIGCGWIYDDAFADCFTNFSTTVVSGNPVNSPGAAIDVAAPGVSVLSTQAGGGTTTMSGTSMSSPHVAGVAALYIVEKGLTPSSASDVYSIRQALIDAGQAQSDWQTGDTRDPDSNPEPLVWALFGNVDSPPSVTLTNPSDGATVSGTETVTADASDDGSVSQVEFFVDGGSIGVDTDGTDGWSASWNTESYSDGDHTVTAEATDDASQTASDQITVTVDNTSSSTSMHIGDLDASAISNGPTWDAVVTILVEDGSHSAVSDATVSGDWSGLGGGNAVSISCTTDLSGQCTVEASGMHKRNGSVTYTVTGVTHGSLTYDANANHDPDGDSDGSSITVSKP